MNQSSQQTEGPGMTPLDVVRALRFAGCMDALAAAEQMVLHRLWMWHDLKGTAPPKLVIAITRLQKAREDLRAILEEIGPVQEGRT